MTLLAGAVWTITDDDGTGTSGTIWNAAWVAAAKTSVEAQLHSTTNPTVTPIAITDEVVTARGASANLNTRLAAMDALIAAASPTAAAVKTVLGQTNLVANEIFWNWYGGDTADPAYWALAGAGGTVQRCGTGLVDTNRKIGDFCARIRRVAATTTLRQRLVSIPAMLDHALGGDTVGFGAWVRATDIGAARLLIDDGAGGTYSASNAAANTWEWLGTTRTIDAAPTYLDFSLVNDTNGADAYISAPTVMLVASTLPPSRWTPSLVEYISRDFVIPGAVAVAAPKFVWAPHRPFIVKDVQLSIGTAPTGAALIVDVNTWDGAAYTSMFTARPQIAATAFIGGAQPDTTYARRCGNAIFGTGVAVGTRLSIDIDQVGSVAAGSDLTISVRMLMSTRAYESLFDFNDV